MTFSPALIVVCGLPGVGKTTAGRYLAAELDADLVRTDVVRKQLFPDPAYTTEEERAVYEELFTRAADTLPEGGDVVLDGTFHARRYRARARAIAEAHDAFFELVHVTCPADTVRERIAAREGDESDATFEIHRQYRDHFDSIECEHVHVDNDGSLPATRHQLKRVLPTVETAD